MSLLDKFLRITSQKHQAVADVMKSIASGLQIHMPIEIRQINDKKKIGINLLSNISKNEQIFMVNAQYSFTSFGYDGAPRAKARRYDEFIRQLITNVYSRQMIPQLFGFYKILIQVAVNILDPSLRLHKYAKYLKGIDLRDLPYSLPVETIQKIQSDILKSAIIGNMRGLQQTYLMISKEYPGLANLNLTQLFLTVHSRSITLNQTILCPLVDLLNHSSKPNCQIQGVYNAHAQSSYIVVKSLKPIKPEQQLTINYGEFSNLQFFLRYGFVVQDNPNSVYILKANYDNHLGNLQQLYELKEDLLKKCGGLKEMLKVTENGLVSESARILRIFLMDAADVTKNKNILDYTPVDYEKPISRQNEKRVQQFLYESLSTSKVCDVSDIYGASEIQKDERRIRDKLMAKLRKQIQIM